MGVSKLALYRFTDCSHNGAVTVSVKLGAIGANDE